MIETTAAVLHGVNAAPSLETILIDNPQPDEILVRVTAAGVCHSDWSVANGTIPQQLPGLVGHEAVAVVEALGERVSSVAVGDRVVTSWIPQCGVCRNCTRGRPQLCELSHFPLRGLQIDGSTRRTTTGGTSLTAMGAVGAFAQHAVIPASAAIPIDDRLPDETAALIGCAVLTGTGAVWNTAHVEPGSHVAVVGAGGIGLNIVAAAHISGAATIVAVDPNPSRRALALMFGATHAFAPDEAKQQTRLVTDGGADYAFEAVGQSATARSAFDLGNAGSTTVLVGMAGMSSKVEIPQFQWVSQERRILGSWFGSTDLRRDIPRIIDLAVSDQLDLASLVTSVRGLGELGAAFADLASGTGLRTVITP